MPKKKKQALTIAVLMVLMIGMAVAYSIITKSNAEKEAKKEEVTTIPIFTLDATQVSKIYFKNATDAMTLVNESNVWVREDDKTIPMNQEFVTSMLSALEKVEATKKLDSGAADISEYGLLEPAVEIVVTTVEGAEHKIRLGSPVPVEGGYYGLSGDDTTIYLLPEIMYTSFQYTKNQMVTIEEAVKVTADRITGLKVKTKEGLDFDAKYVGGEAEENSYYTWDILKPYPKVTQADTTSMNELLAKFTDFTFDECIDYNATDLTQYGLEEPSATIVMDYYDVVGTDDTTDTATQIKENKTYRLKVGSQNEEGNYYVQEAESGTVYLMKEQKVSSMITWDPFTVADHCIYLGLVTDLTGLDIYLGDEMHKIERKEEVSTAEDGTETTINVYYVDGNKVDEETFLGIYSASYLFELSGIVDDNSKTDSKSEVLKLVYHPIEGNDFTVVFTPYDDVNFYRVNKNGIDYFLTNKRAVDDVIQRYKDMIDNLG